MFIRILKSDFIKLKHSPVWLAFLMMPVIPALLGTLNYQANAEILTKEWFSLWTQHTLFTCYFFLPATIGIYCSYLIHLEHTNCNWNKVLTMPVPPWQIFLSKFSICSFLVLLSVLWTGALFLICGKIIGFSLAAVPPAFIEWILCGAAGGTVIVALQLCLSLLIRNFAVPVGISLLGGVMGLAALTKGLGLYFPYALMELGMRSNAPQKFLESGYASFFISCALFLSIFIFAGTCLIKKSVK